MNIARVIHQSAGRSQIQLRFTALALLASLCFAIVAPLQVQAQQAASMVITGPVTAPVDGVVSIAIYVKTTTPVNAVQADVKFPTDLLSYQSVSSTGSAFDADLISNAANGNLSLVRIKIDGGSGDMLVSTVTFKAIKNGKAVLQLLDSSMATDAQTSENIVTVRQGLTVQIGDPALNTPDTGGNGTTDGGTTQTPTEDVNGDGIVDIRDIEATASPTPTEGDAEATPTPLGGEVALNEDASGTTGDGISSVTWLLAGGSILLIIVSVFFSLRLLNRRSRRGASYPPYTMPSQQVYGSDVYGYGANQYQLPQSGYVTPPNQAYPQSVPANSYPYPSQPAQTIVQPAQPVPQQAQTYQPVPQGYQQGQQLPPPNNEIPW